MENWIEVLEFNKDTEEMLEYFLKLLDDKKIPHKEEIKGCWGGSARLPKYEQNIIVFVPKEYKERVEKYLKEYTNPNNNVYEEVEELKTFSSEDEENEYKKRNIAQKILILIPFIMVGIVIICAIISGIIY